MLCTATYKMATSLAAVPLYSLSPVLISQSLNMEPLACISSHTLINGHLLSSKYPSLPLEQITMVVFRF